MKIMTEINESDLIVALKELAGGAILTLNCSWLAPTAKVRSVKETGSPLLAGIK
jgi:hypothetical protein